LTLVTALGVHFSLVVLYLSGPNLAKAALGPTAAEYTRPFFRQNWHLFSPNPGISSRKLAIRCQGDSGPWSEWFDPLEPMFAEFFDARLGGLGKLIFVYRGIADALIEQAASAGKACRAAMARARKASPESTLPAGAAPDPVEEPAPESIPERPSIPEDLPECGHGDIAADLIDTPAFEVASRYARAMCEAWLEPEHGGLARYQFKLLEFFPLKYSEREAGVDRRWSRVVELPWPVVEGVE